MNTIIKILLFVAVINILILHTKITTLKEELADITNKYTLLQEDMDRANIRVEKYEEAYRNENDKLADVNSLLNKCYQDLDVSEQAHQQIEENMKNPKPSTDKPAESYQPISRKTYVAGIDFINDQMGKINAK